MQIIKNPQYFMFGFEENTQIDVLDGARRQAQGAGDVSDLPMLAELAGVA